jgi:hypothetical protein
MYSGTTVSGLSVSSVQLGGAADNFTQAFSQTVTANQWVNAVWLDPNCAGGQTAVKVTASGSNSTTQINLFAYEISGYYPGYPLDILVANVNTQNNTAWTITGTNTQKDTLWVGAIAGWRNGAALSITGPSSPWTANGTTEVDNSVSSANFTSLAGFTNAVTGGAGSVTFNGTVNAAASSKTVILLAVPGTLTPGSVSWTVSDANAASNSTASGQSGAWGLPPLVTAVKAEGWAGGGGAGSPTTSGAGSGGGGGGEYAAEPSAGVGAAAYYAWSTGAGGAGSAVGGASGAGAGGNTTFTPDTTAVTAHGGGAGVGGVGGTPGGGGAGGTGSTNTTH